MSIRIALAAGCAAVLTAAAAQATTLDFSYADKLVALTASWTQSDTPTVISSGSDHTSVSVAGTESAYGTIHALTEVNFFNATAYPSGGGFTTGTVPYIGSPGPIVYTGSEAAPVFAPGVYHLAYGDLTVTVAVPEPATWSMMLVGVAGLGGVLRASRRRRLVVA